MTGVSAFCLYLLVLVLVLALDFRVCLCLCLFLLRRYFSVSAFSVSALAFAGFRQNPSLGIFVLVSAFGLTFF